jgi:hypothetical protein
MDMTANVLLSFSSYINFHHITYAYNHSKLWRNNYEAVFINKFTFIRGGIIKQSYMLQSTVCFCYIFKYFLFSTLISTLWHLLRRYFWTGCCSLGGLLGLSVGLLAGLLGLTPTCSGFPYGSADKESRYLNIKHWEEVFSHTRWYWELVFSNTRWYGELVFSNTRWYGELVFLNTYMVGRRYLLTLAMESRCFQTQ